MFKIPTQERVLYVNFPGVAPPPSGGLTLIGALYIQGKFSAIYCEKSPFEG